MTTKTQVSIGGSTAAAACGLDPFRSRVQLWLELTGRVEPPDMSEAMKWGTLLEPVIAAEIAERGEYRIEHAAPPQPNYMIDGFPYLHAHPDGFAYLESDLSRAGVFECKTTNQYRAREWKDDAVPTAYVIQTQHNMFLTSCTWALVACLIGGQRLELRRVERDEALIENLLRAEEEFVRLVETDTAPAPDGSESADAMLKLLYPEAEVGKRVALTGSDMELVARIKTLKKTAKATDGQLDTAEQTLKARLGDGEQGWYEGVKVVSWPTVHSQRLDTTRVKEEYPEVYAACVKESSYRALRVVGS